MIGCRHLGRAGRLGNSLYQIASTVGLARSRGDLPVFPEDWIYRPFFSMPDHWFNNEQLALSIDVCHLVKHIDPRAVPYLQDVSLFIDILPELRAWFEPSPAGSQIIADFVDELENWAQLKPPVLGVHVRRGDLVFDPGIPNKSDYHILQSLDYYLFGILSMPNEYFNSIAVFSDDIEWCRQNMKFANFYSNGISHPKEQEPEYWTQLPYDFVDLILLSQCDCFVITGSTFGIWAAMLADVPDDHVVRPSRIYGPAISYVDSELMFPPGWRVIDAS
jgi:Glycosyl transferase family 11